MINQYKPKLSPKLCIKNEIITELIFKPERKSYAIAMYASCQNMQSSDNSANGMLKHK